MSYVNSLTNKSQNNVQSKELIKKKIFFSIASLSREKKNKTKPKTLNHKDW